MVLGRYAIAEKSAWSVAVAHVDVWCLRVMHNDLATRIITEKDAC